MAVRSRAQTSPFIICLELCAGYGQVNHCHEHTAWCKYEWACRRQRFEHSNGDVAGCGLQMVYDCSLRWFRVQSMYSLCRLVVRNGG